ncbi:MAG: homoserine dehydrogenase, partial [Fimbriimonas ginsengisoli]|nr:homoserine dehydrogenase [Fimbriimonas ginsengisoli]
AAVGGGIPLIQPIKHQLAGNDILRMAGILNGTTNLILSRMTDEGEPLETVLAEAQGKGYAEADPSSDVDGHDVQFKLAILSSVAFGKAVRPEQIYREGIRGIEQADIAYAKTLGYVIKLLGIVEAVEGGSILGRVHPTLLPKAHPLAAVGGVYNALCLRGDFVGDVTFMGRGAGGEATGSAVVGDLIDVCRNMRIGGSGDAAPFSGEANARPIEELTSAYYVRVVVPDRPLVLGAIATIFGRRNVSLSAMEMRVIDTKLNHGEIAFLTHRCLEADLRQAVEELRHAPEVLRVCNWIRVETL